MDQIIYKYSAAESRIANMRQAARAMRESAEQIKVKTNQVRGTSWIGEDATAFGDVINGYVAALQEKADGLAKVADVLMQDVQANKELELAQARRAQELR